MGPRFSVLILLLISGAVVTALGGCTADATEESGPGDPGSDPGERVALEVAATSLRFAADTDDDRPTVPAGAPITLTAADGTGLRLVALEVRGVLEAPLAFTELRMSFANPEERTIEGRFRITLPPEAAISRFAMQIGGHWQEGEVVERQRARRIYEDFLHRRQDPALLEHEAGNEFSARVFPIPAGGTKELIVSYSHALPRADQPYVVPLLGLPEIGTFDLRLLLGERPAGEEVRSNLGATVSDRRVITLHQEDWTPTADFEVSQDYAGDRLGLRRQNLVLLRLAPGVDARPQEIPALFVLFDVSASRALGYGAQIDLLRALLAALRDGAGPKTPVGLVAFDQSVTPIYDGPVGELRDRHFDELNDLGPLGASDLHQALSWLAATLGEDGRRFARVLVVTDGVLTAGETGGQALGAAVRALGAVGVERLDVLAVGGRRDPALLRQLVTGKLAGDGQVIDAAAGRDEIARRLTRSCRSGIEVGVRGAAWVWPRVLDGIQPGDEVLVYADLPAGRDLDLTLDGTAVDLGGELVEVPRPLLERSWVGARMARLLHLRETDFAADPDLRQALTLEVTELSVRHRVLSPSTAFLVLETEWDYERYQLDRTALADILTVGAAGLEVVNRTPPPARPRPKPPVLERERMELKEALRVRAEVVDHGVEADQEMPAPTDVVLSLPDALEPEPAGLPGRDEGGEAFAPSEPAVAPEPPPPSVEEAMDVEELRVEAGPSEEPPPEEPGEAWSGRFAEVMAHLEAGRTGKALALAESWRREAPGDVLALVALGEVCESGGEVRRAARAYGSLIDLFPSRADLRRYAGQRLERLRDDVGLGLAVDTYEKATVQRPDHPSGHRLLAWARLKTGRAAAAFETLEAALRQQYPRGRFVGVEQILREDLGLVAAAWLRAEPERRREVERRLRDAGARLEDEPSLRFVLTWETDANDVDLHVHDRRGDHAYYNARRLPSGGRLYADVTTGYGPECFTIPLPAKNRAYPYRLQAHYYRRGPMGYGMGTLQILEHDGRGRLGFEERPFVVMSDGAFVELGKLKGSLLATGS